MSKSTLQQPPRRGVEMTQKFHLLSTISSTSEEKIQGDNEKDNNNFTSITTVTNKKTDKMTTVVVQEEHPTFPRSKHQQRCCPLGDRLCCHGLLDTDDLILRQERRRLKLNMKMDEEDELDLDLWDKFTRTSTEVFLCPCGHKRPSCCTHPVLVLLFVLYQIFLGVTTSTILVAPAVLRLFCLESSMLGISSSDSLHCVQVQHHLRASSGDDGDSSSSSSSMNVSSAPDNFAGMLSTMRQLAKTNMSSRYVFELIHNA